MRSAMPTGKRLPRVAARAKRRAKRVALDVLHHQVVADGAGAHFEDGHDVRVMNARSDARFVQEHLDELFLARQMRMQPLHRDEALKAADAGQARKVHRGHATGRDLAHQLIAIDALSPRAGVEEFRHSLEPSERPDARPGTERHPRLNAEALRPRLFGLPPPQVRTFSSRPSR